MKRLVISRHILWLKWMLKNVSLSAFETLAYLQKAVWVNTILFVLSVLCTHTPWFVFSIKFRVFSFFPLCRISNKCAPPKSDLSVDSLAQLFYHFTCMFPSICSLVWKSDPRCKIQLEMTIYRPFQNIVWAGQTMNEYGLVWTGQPAYQLFQNLAWASQTMLTMELVWTGQPVTSCFKT